MKIKYFIPFFILFGCFKDSLGAVIQPGFDRSVYYNILRANKVAEIDSEYSVIDASAIKEKEAYEGTLLMKKAGLVKKPKEKIRLFKEGQIKLETALRNDGNNPEYHFLRLVIQEHAPKVTKYRAHLEEDAEYIKKNYKNLLPAVQRVVIDYSKTSSIIHSSDF